MQDAAVLWEQAGIENDFLFGKIMSKPENCKPLLERILGIPIARLEAPELQKEVEPAYDARGVRYDVYVEDDRETAYDIEMQTVKQEALPQRIRYYGSMMDLNLIEKGALYDELKKCYVIFICTFDWFGCGRHIYTFENLCREDPSLPLTDGAFKIFLNATGTANDVRPELKRFLDYVAGTKSEDPYIQQLDREVQLAKQNREWRNEYMMQNLRELEAEKRGVAIGVEKGIEQQRAETIYKLLLKYKNAQMTANILDEELAEVVKVAKARHLPLEDLPQ